MYEFTMGGWWFRWSALDREGKRLAGASLAASALAGGSLGAFLARPGPAGTVPGGPPLPALPLAMVLWMLGWLTVSAVLWWRFSRRQDELFNRVQNWALGMGGAWSATFAIVWEVLAMGGLLPAIGILHFAVMFALLTLVFWFVAVLRWAS